MKGDRVEIVIDAGSGTTRTYEVTATRAGRRVNVTHGRGVVEVSEVTRGGSTVRTARFLANRVLVMSARPGRIVRDIPITLRRPRQVEDVTTTEFIRFKADIMAEMRGHH